MEIQRYSSSKISNPNQIPIVYTLPVWENLVEDPGGDSATNNGVLIAGYGSSMHGSMVLMTCSQIDLNYLTPLGWPHQQ